jgi:eukaryotic-like serine/threonine-protein kinase
MASVWLARLSGKHGFEKLFAIKTILPQFAEDERFQQMFLDEARIASRIEHANVAQVLDLGEEHGILYLVMQWVDGDSLSRMARTANRSRVKIPIPIVLRILADTCAGLHAAHEVMGPEGHTLGVVHRDVSPQNILVTPDGVPKLIDFGVAKARGRLGGDTVAGQLKGKIHYMAREQALGDAIDRRADVFSVAAVAYALIAGAPPYEGPNDLATLHLLTSGRPPPPLPPGVPAPIERAIMAGLVHDPEQRTPTALALQQSFEGAMIEADCLVKTADVRAFVRELLAEQHQSRRRALDAALRAAEERRNLADGLKPIAGGSSSGIGPPSGRAAVLTSSSRMSHPEPQVEPRSSGGLTPGSSSSASWSWPAKGDLPLAASSVSEIGSVPSVQSSATLGSAAADVHLPVARTRRLPAVWIALAVVTTALATTGVFMLRSPNGGTAASAAAPSNGSSTSPAAATVTETSPTTPSPPPLATAPAPPGAASPPVTSAAAPKTASGPGATKGTSGADAGIATPTPPWRPPSPPPIPRKAPAPAAPPASPAHKDYGF